MKRSKTYRIHTGYGKLYVTFTKSEGNIQRCFIHTKHSKDLYESIAQLISLILSHNIPPDIIVDLLDGLRSLNPVWQNGKQILSGPHGIAMALKEELK